MKVVLFNRFFYPDTSATGQLLSDLAFHLAQEGWNVEVVASCREGQPSLARVRGVMVHHAARAGSGRHGLLRRAWEYAAYWLGARRYARRRLAAGDLVVLMSDPPLLSVMVGPLAKSRGATVALWLQDIFPEVAIKYGIAGMAGIAGRVLTGLRDRSLARCDALVAISTRMAAHLEGSCGVSSRRVRVIHNWADGNLVRPVAASSNGLRRAWELAGKFVVGYSGNLGRVHEFDTLLGAAAILADDPDIVFLIVGNGPLLAEVRKGARTLGLGNLRFQPHQDRDSLSLALGVADVHLCVLRPEFEGLVHPSKLYGIMAAGRPTIFVGDREGETASILARTLAGSTVQTGDSRALAAAIVRMRDHHAERVAMGHEARQAFEREFDQPIALRRWKALLQEIA